ncbi:MAG: TylF/MycF/NovP-related O-methyltransferase [Allosphingosinicella sp.]
MSFSLSARLRREVARFLWPPAFAAPLPPPLPPGTTYAGDGLITQNNSDFLDDPRFRRAYAAGEATGSWRGHALHWRAYVICWAATRALSVPGDFVECGVNRGGFSRMLADYVGLDAFPDRKLYLVDTFCGLPERDLPGAAGKGLEGFYAECHDDVLRTFADVPNAVVIRGLVPEILPDVPARTVCYLSIDLNTVEPSVAALAHFWPLMSPGAVAVLDDYGFVNFRDQKQAFDLFAAGLGVEILMLPTGQGLLIKPPAG